MCMHLIKSVVKFLSALHSESLDGTLYSIFEERKNAEKNSGSDRRF